MVVLRETGLSLQLYHRTKPVRVSVSLCAKQKVVSSLRVCRRSNGVLGYIKAYGKLLFYGPQLTSSVCQALCWTVETPGA